MGKLGTTKKALSQSREKYLVQNPWLYWILKIRDSIGYFFSTDLPSSKPLKFSLPPKKILICNLAHLGDAVLSTTVLEPLKNAYPNCKIGFLGSSWSLPVLKKHPSIDHIHILDHWKHNRAPISMLKKWIRHRRTRFLALREVKQNNYDLAIDLYYFAFNAIPFLKKANIPLRVGYTSGGFGFYLTHALDWKKKSQHVTQYYADLLHLCGISSCTMRINLPDPPSHEIQKLKQKYLLPLRYCIFHMGSGSKERLWQDEKWQQLLDHFLQDYEDMTFVFTGQGEDEGIRIQKVIQKRPRCIDLSNRLSWQEFLALISQTSLLVGLESLAGHIAAAYNRRSLLIYSGMTDTCEWRPLSVLSVIVKNNLNCSPCYRSHGCRELSCLQDISTEMVYKQHPRLTFQD